MTSNNEYYIGLMSGTSMDGIDAVLAEISSPNSPLAIRTVSTASAPFSAELYKTLDSLSRSGEDEIYRLGQADIHLAHTYASLVESLLTNSGIHRDEIMAIGSHGQTIRHHPDIATPFTLQIGDPNTLAELTDINVVGDFRRRDIAAGGEGAPLVPAFHQALFGSTDDFRILLNIGGMANISILGQQDLLGYDTGPGNILMDSWCRQHLGKGFDHNGEWAASGKIDTALLDSLLGEAYFHAPFPKSTGRELFNLTWLKSHTEDFSLSPEDIQATLTELTATSIANEISKHNSAGEIYVCGGGALNSHLMSRLANALPRWKVKSTTDLGVDPQWMEALAFAWLARQRVHKLPANAPTVTGAKGLRILGALYEA
ncbi:anhydro-N-acetylmuramic acid kinase [Pokkaliibacter sp. CJK22405]|uniref:anhydro-N-acetylmuramic acid kinase n=1 Tax=Pokkaliibacter sp. CJK22405 TaxID=3384615 RepID=UPI003984DC9A